MCPCSVPSAHQLSFTYSTLLPTRNTFCDNSSRNTEPSTHSTCLVSIRFLPADPSQLLIESWPCHTDQCAEQKRYQCELCRALIRPWAFDIAKHKQSHDLEGKHQKRGYSCCRHRFTEDSLRGHLALCLPGCNVKLVTEVLANTPSSLRGRVIVPRRRKTADKKVAAPIRKRTLFPRPPTVESFDVSLFLCCRKDQRNGCHSGSLSIPMAFLSTKYVLSALLPRPSRILAVAQDRRISVIVYHKGIL